jgi:hypothetical protein
MLWACVTSSPPKAGSAGPETARPRIVAPLAAVGEQPLRAAHKELRLLPLIPEPIAGGEAARGRLAAAAASWRGRQRTVATTEAPPHLPKRPRRHRHSRAPNRRQPTSEQ